MKKKILVIMLLVFLSLISLFAEEEKKLQLEETDRLSYYLKGTVSPAFCSQNIYSSIPKNGKTNWELGLDFTLDIYKNDTTKNIGLSNSLYIAYPFLEKSYVGGKVSNESSSSNLTLFVASGLILRSTPSYYLDASLAIRLGLISYDYFKSGIILASNIEANADYYLYDSLFITASLSLTNGFYRLEDYKDTSFLVRLKLGCGYKIGDKRR